MNSPAIALFLLIIKSIFLANLLVLRAFSVTPQQNDFFNCLTLQFESSNSVIYTPNNASSYASLLKSYDLKPASTSPHKPLLIITPFYESEIQSAIYCSKKLGIQIRVRSGGHDFEGLSYTSPDPFVIVDMRNFHSISINLEDKTAWVQVGATLGQFYFALAQKSKTLAFSAGVCPSVGVGGHFSGGGYGMMSRKHALASDHIIDAKLVDANGRILDRKSMGEDHFWASTRGGGGTSFGIILAFKVDLVTVPETVTVFRVSRTLEQNLTRLVHKWQYIAHKIDENLVMRVTMRTTVASPTNENRTVLAYFTSLFLGRVRDLVPLMQKEFPELGLVDKDFIEMSWIESVLFLWGIENKPLDVLLNNSILLPSTMYYKRISDYVTQPIPMNGIRGIWRFLNEEIVNRGEVEFSPYGGVLNNFSEYEIPFPHRAGNMFVIYYEVSWDGEGNDELLRQVNWITRLYSYMAPYVSKSPRSAYFNYRDLDIGMNNYNQDGNTSYEQASVWGFKCFKKNFNRLVRVKTRVDPFNFFRNEQSIPPFMSELDSW